MKALLRQTEQCLTSTVAVFTIMQLPLSAAETKTSTQISQANNLASKDCGVVLSVPDFLERNVNDDQAITDPNYEKWDRDHVPSAGEKDLKEVTVTAKTGDTAGVLTLTVSGNVAAITCPVSGFTNTIYWSDKEKNARYPQSNHTTLSWNVPANTPSFSVILYIEGVENSNSPADIKFVAELTCSGKAPAKDPGETAVYEVDLDIDSLNDNSFEPLGYENNMEAEDKIEVSEKPGRTGKVCVANNQRHPQNQRVPGWADGFNATLSPDDDILTDVEFIPVKILLKTPINPVTARIRFSYISSDPTAVIMNGTPPRYFLADGLCRLWTLPASAARNKSSIVLGGNYVPPDDFLWSTLSETSSVLLYLECVRGSLTKNKISIVVTDGKSVCKDDVNLSFESIEVVSQTFIALLNDDVFDYIETGEKAQNDAANRIRIASDINYVGLQNVTANLSSSASLQDMFKPPSGAGAFKSVLKSLGNGAEQSAVRNITANNAKMEHKMRPALYRNQYHITAYSTSDENDFTGNAVNTDTYYVRGLNHYYFINSNVAARAAFLRDVAIEGYGSTLNHIVIQATPMPRTTPNPRPAGTDSRTKFFNINMASVPAPLGIANRPLIDGQSCAITRYGNTTRGQVIPDNSSVVLVEAANVSYTNRGNVLQSLGANRQCVDRVTAALGAWHIDAYVHATRAQRDTINFQSQVILKEQ